MPFINFDNVAWCLAGDFNSVRNSDERKGVSSQQVTREMKEFDDFIENMGLNDLPLVGQKYLNGGLAEMSQITAPFY